MGISSAAEVYHRSMEQMFEGLEGVRIFVDDILIWGFDQVSHDARLAHALERVKQYNLKLKKEKCEISKSEITFLGDRLSRHGIQPGLEKIEAIHNYEIPTCKKDLQRMMGMVQYVGRFIPNLASKSKALRQLLEDRNEWVWGPEHEQEWDELKQILSKEPVLKFFDPACETNISTDASKSGLGAVLLQKHGCDWAPMAYAARSMTESEERYAQIEKECLGLVFGCEKFHSYIYGLQNVEAETDHKPLITIAKKNLVDMTPRIQRLMMKLQRYDLRLSFTPGKFLIMADALSRARYTQMHTDTETEQDVDLHVNMVLSNLPVSDVQWTNICVETKKDPILKRVMKYLHEGWPKGACKQYFPYRDELAILNGVILKGSRIVVPTSLRKDMLSRLHEGHAGMEKAKRMARVNLFWPGMNDDIEKLVTNCETCLKYRYSQPKQPMIIANDATQPWEKVGADLFHLNDKTYLIVVDYFSNYPEVALINSATADTVVKHMKSMFSRHGIPQYVVTDGGPCFIGAPFTQFAEIYGFQHILSSPYYAQSNGKAEKGVQIVKRMWKKCKESNGDPYLAMLMYRASPLESGKSPAELLMNRRLRTRLPQASVNPGIRKNKSAQIRQKYYYDRGAHELPELQKNDVVRIQTQHGWNEKAKVLQTVAPRSYQVLSELGKTYVRNRRHLLKTNELFQSTQPVYDPIQWSPSNKATTNATKTWPH